MRRTKHSQSSNAKGKSPRELRIDFAHTDRDKDGRVDYGEFKELLAGLDAGMSEEEMHIGFREIDTDHDGRIDLREFSDWWNGD